MYEYEYVYVYVYAHRSNITLNKGEQLLLAHPTRLIGELIEECV